MITPVEQHTINMIRKKSRIISAKLESGSDVRLARVVLQRQVEKMAERFREIGTYERPSCDILTQPVDLPNVWFSSDLFWYKCCQLRREPHIARPIFM